MRILPLITALLITSTVSDPEGIRFAVTGNVSGVRELQQPWLNYFGRQPVCVFILPSTHFLNLEAFILRQNLYTLFLCQMLR